MQLFYNPLIISNKTSEIELDKDESRHIYKVLRKNVGDKLTFTNGSGSFFETEIIRVGKTVKIKILSEEKATSLPYSLHLAVAPTKLNDRYEWFIEKATEIGISEITPIICEHSERRVIKKDRFEKIIQSAMKQSLKAHMPILNDAISFKDFINSEPSSEIKLIAHCSDGEKSVIKKVVHPGKSVMILIGPEGDFSDSEIKMSESLGFQSIHLGNSRLRTETAAIVACHSVSFINHE